jgi:hypothetical protein
MDLTEEQIAAVKRWVQEGASLAEVQQRLREDFSLTLTYMDVRFLVDDIGADLADSSAEPAEPAPPASGPEAPESATEGEAVDLDPVDEAGDPLPYDAGPGSLPGKLSVDVDKVMRPGAVVSGSVTFTDGVTANWQIDQMGRLGIIPPREGYQPPEEDLTGFQVELQQVLQQQGF